MVSNVMTFVQRQKIKSKYEEKRLYELVSGILDRILAVVFLIITLPILFFCMILIRLEDGGPVLYSQNRVGKEGDLFVVYKMRSMYIAESESDNGLAITKVNDPRITRIGKFIRMTRIDEIPQLLNILIGNMKLIGPRPLVEEQIIEYVNDLPEFVDRLAVKPGVTGWAQVNGGNDVTPREKLFFDIEYIKNRGLQMYLKVILKTVWVVLSGEGAR